MPIYGYIHQDENERFNMFDIPGFFVPDFSLQVSFRGMDDLQVIQSLLIKSYFMGATWDIVGRLASHHVFLSLNLKSALLVSTSKE